MEEFKLVLRTMYKRAKVNPNMGACCILYAVSHGSWLNSLSYDAMI